MHIYKRSTWEMIKGLILAPFAAIIVYIVGGFFIANTALLGGIAGVIVLFMIYSTVVGENIHFEIENGELRYYKRGKLKEQYRIADCSFGYHRRTERSFPPTHDIKLRILNTQSGEETSIDCSPIGVNRFDSMFEQLESLSGGEPEVLRATPAGL